MNTRREGLIRRLKLPVDPGVCRIGTHRGHRVRVGESRNDIGPGHLGGGREAMPSCLRWVPGELRMALSDGRRGLWSVIALRNGLRDLRAGAAGAESAMLANGDTGGANGGVECTLVAGRESP